MLYMFLIYLKWFSITKKLYSILAILKKILIYGCLKVLQERDSPLEGLCAASLTLGLVCSLTHPETQWTNSSMKVHRLCEGNSLAHLGASVGGAEGSWGAGDGGLGRPHLCALHTVCEHRRAGSDMAPSCCLVGWVAAAELPAESRHPHTDNTPPHCTTGARRQAHSGHSPAAFLEPASVSRSQCFAAALLKARGAHSPHRRYPLITWLWWPRRLTLQSSVGLWDYNIRKTLLGRPLALGHWTAKWNTVPVFLWKRHFT